MLFVGIASARIAILYADKSVQQQSINYGMYVCSIAPTSGYHDDINLIHVDYKAIFNRRLFEHT